MPDMLRSIRRRGVEKSRQAPSGGNLPLVFFPGIAESFSMAGGISFGIEFYHTYVMIPTDARHHPEAPLFFSWVAARRIVDPQNVQAHFGP